MKVVYDPEVDVLSVLLSDAPVAESDQDKPGVILDYDAGGNMVSFEILDASKRMTNPLSVEYAVAAPASPTGMMVLDALMEGGTLFLKTIYPSRRATRKRR